MYCAVEDVKGEVYLPLLSRMEAHHGGGLDSFLLEHIQRATDYMNAVLSESFDVPIPCDPSPPDVLVTIAAKLAAYYATARFSEQEEVSGDRKEAAVDMLKALVRSGRIPGLDSDLPAPGGVRITGGGNPQVFTDEYMRGW